MNVILCSGSVGGKFSYFDQGSNASILQLIEQIGLTAFMHIKCRNGPDGKINIAGGVAFGVECHIIGLAAPTRQRTEYHNEHDGEKQAKENSLGAFEYGT